MTTCPYCRTEIGAEQAAVTCTRCGLPYHRECWHENGGCATYGCRGGATAGAGPVTTGGPLDVDLGRSRRGNGRARRRRSARGYRDPCSACCARPLP